MPRLFVSAAHKSSGKTTVAIGLAAALCGRGCTVQPFKKGPDYIDPMWLTRAAGRACINLDPYLMDTAAIAAAVDRASAGADLALIEGNKGLHDGVALDGSNSSAALARQLQAPVVLVVDARGMTRGVAPLVLGFQAFDRGVQLAGVILNQVGGSRHEGKLRAAIEAYTDVPVLGALGHDERLALPERHLGLTPDAEFDGAADRVEQIARLVADGVDLDRVRAVAASAPAWPGGAPALRPLRPGASADLRIAIARDRAFGFYYPDDLQALEEAGAQLLPFDTLHDTTLPPADGLFIGGGFPEVFMAELEANVALRRALRDAIAGGLPTYAECGGLMYLARSICWGERRAEMVGAIPGDVVMHARPVGRGYVHLETGAAHPWGAAPGSRLRGHEFHHSSLENLPVDSSFAYRVRRGHGIDGANDGLVVGHLLASYGHLRTGAGSDWAPRFVEFVRACRGQRAAD
ncbi:MAG: cobyrinate a,c-diamide synthase, partial [Rubrivivax sp.]|nr:cobyrinate a,c-diamide synthase [Rubrivivax sp.]